MEHRERKPAGAERPIHEQLLEAIDEAPMSDRALSLLASGSTDTVRNMRRGATPRLETVEALCRALGLKLKITGRRRHRAAESA